MKLIGVLFLCSMLCACQEDVHSKALLKHCINGVQYVSKTGSNSSLTVLVNRDFSPVICGNKE